MYTNIYIHLSIYPSIYIYIDIYKQIYILYRYIYYIHVPWMPIKLICVYIWYKYTTYYKEKDCPRRMQKWPFIELLGARDSQEGMAKLHILYIYIYIYVWSMHTICTKWYKKQKNIQYIQHITKNQTLHLQDTKAAIHRIAWCEIQPRNNGRVVYVI